MEAVRVLRRHAPRRLLLNHMLWNVVMPPIWRGAPGLVSQPSRVVFVCLGNVCRSPYAEMRARQAGLRASSCGLSVDSSVRSPSAAVEAAAERGIDLSAHRSRPLKAAEVEPHDLVLVMEPYMLSVTRRRLERAGTVVSLLGLYGHPTRRPTPYIPDPHGLPAGVFSLAYEMIDQCVDHLASTWRSTEL